MVEKEQKELELEPVFDPSVNGLVVKNFEANKQLVIDYCKSLKVGSKIKDDKSYKEAKDKWHSLNARFNVIDKVRKTTKKIAVATIEEQLKEITGILDEYNDKLKAEMTRYEESIKPVEETPVIAKAEIKTYGVIITSADKDVIAEIKKIAKEKKCVVSEVK